MSRFIPEADMTAAQVWSCCVQARAILSLCEHAAEDLPVLNTNTIPQLAEDIQFALKAALEMLRPVQDALEAHEGTKGGSE